MNYNLMPVKYFIDVVQTRGFISAAKRNYVSETAVSLAVNKLEKQLGDRLLNRSGGQFSLTPAGEEFYKRATEIIDAYTEIWRHPNEHLDKLLRIHFLQGMGNYAALFASKLPKQYDSSFDEEVYDSSISRLVMGNYDFLIGFENMFANNAKITTFTLKVLDFDLLFNKKEFDKESELQELSQHSKLYMQNWNSSGISHIQTKMLEQYNRYGWGEEVVASVNSFEAACLCVNFRGGITMVPKGFLTPSYCENIYKFSPDHLKNVFRIVVAISSSRTDKLAEIVTNSLRQ